MVIEANAFTLFTLTPVSQGVPLLLRFLLWAQADLNRRPHAYQACALTS